MDFFAILFSSAALAFAIHVTVELPTSNLISILMAPKPRHPKPNNGTESEEDNDVYDGSLLPLPFEGESSFLPALPAPPQLLALPAPVHNVTVVTDHRTKHKSKHTADMKEPLAGPDLETGDDINHLTIA